jgi:hypothetical protein
MFGCALTAVEHPAQIISVTVRQSSCVMSVKSLVWATPRYYNNVQGAKHLNAKRNHVIHLAVFETSALKAWALQFDFLSISKSRIASCSECR